MHALDIIIAMVVNALTACLLATYTSLHLPWPSTDIQTHHLSTLLHVGGPHDALMQHAQTENIPSPSPPCARRQRSEQTEGRQCNQPTWLRRVRRYNLRRLVLRARGLQIDRHYSKITSNKTFQVWRACQNKAHKLAGDARRHMAASIHSLIRIRTLALSIQGYIQTQDSILA